MFVRNYFYKSKANSSKASVSTNLLQIIVLDHAFNFENIEQKIKDNVDYLKLKSFTTDENERQYNFWFSVKEKNSSEFIKLIENITRENKKVSIQIFSRTGIYE